MVGAGVTLSGLPTLTIAGAQAGTFTNGPALVGFGSGVILSSGLAADASGNYAGSDLASTDLSGSGDAQLSLLVGGAATYDSASLEFSFIPTGSTIFFNYTFASAEYPNFVGSQYNDVFAFFVDGQNYALVPGSNNVVAINSVNPGNNPAYFSKYNAAGDELPYGGQTVVLAFSAP